MVVVVVAMVAGFTVNVAVVMRVSVLVMIGMKLLVIVVRVLVVAVPGVPVCRLAALVSVVPHL